MGIAPLRVQSVGAPVSTRSTIKNSPARSFDRAALSAFGRNGKARQRRSRRRGRQPRMKMLGNQDRCRYCIQPESLARTYERPALRKAFAAFAADSKVA